jgi:hypothetical protein
MSYTNHPPPKLAPIVRYLETGGLAEMSGMIDSLIGDQIHVAVEADMLSALMFLAAQAVDQRVAPVKLVFGS